MNQAVYHRVITDRGQNPDDEDYGLNVVGMLHRGMTSAEVAQVPGRLEAEIRKDPRVDTVRVTLTTEGAAGDRWKIGIRGQSDQGPFDLVVSVGAAGAVLLGTGGGG